MRIDNDEFDCNMAVLDSLKDENGNSKFDEDMTQHDGFKGEN